MVVGFMMNVLCAIVSCYPNFGMPGDNQQQGLMMPRLFGRSSSIVLDNTPMVSPAIVDTLGGSLEGYYMKTISGRKIVAFEGIPYAEAPVGQRRFRPPVAKKPWKGVRQAKSSAPYCLQMHTFFLDRIIGVEDCLQLNVYTPTLPVKENPKLPVIIFIHGGSYQFSGAVETGPAYLLERDVVVVMINYRLGILGFMSTGDEASPGNNGLRDQAMAIEWVHKNIENFGGDPRNVTLLGESAGASSVHLHMLSKRETRNYFQKAIAMSATAFNFWALQSPLAAQRLTSLAARHARCPQRDSHELMRCMRSKNPVTLVSNQMKMLDYWPNFPTVMFAPVIEKDTPEAYITESPEETYRRNGTAPVPMIISNTEGEGEVLIVALPSILLFSPIQRDWRRMAPVILDYKNIPGVDQERVTDEVEKYYFKDGATARTLPMTGFSNMTTDRYFSPGIYNAIRAHSQIAPVYSSVFNYRGRFGIPTAFGLGREGSKYRVAHTEDMFYVMNMTRFSQGLKLSDPEYKIAKFMVDTIVGFAESGSPDASAFNITWPQVEGDNIPQLAIDKLMTVNPYPQSASQAIKFWESLNLTDGSFHSFPKTS